MKHLQSLPTWADKQHIYAVVETPRGSRAKLAYEVELGAFVLSKPLLAGLTYPYRLGLHSVHQSKGRRPPRYSNYSRRGHLSWGRALLQTDWCSRIGSVSRRGKSNGMIVFSSCPIESPFEGDLQDIRHLPARAIEELERFFEATDFLEKTKLEFKGWHGPSRAIQTIKKLSN